MSNFVNVKGLVSDDRVVMLRDVRIPAKFYDKIKTTSQVLDEIFGGPEHPGIMRGTCNLFTGVPGAGKSTMSLQLAELLQLQGHRVLYNIGEENEVMVKIAANRLGIRGEFPISKFEEVEELRKYVIEEGVDVLFQDSLQSMSDGQLTGNKLLKSVVKQVVQLSKDETTTIFLIGHATKGGDFAGPARIKHDADAHIHLSLDPESGCRTFQLQKNRFGPALVPYQFSLSATGLDFQQADDRAVVVGSRIDDKKAATIQTIRDLLVAGKKLSGYSYEEEPELIALGLSGGFMRAMLRMTCNQLKAEGMTVGSCTINRREHSYVELESEEG